MPYQTSEKRAAFARHAGGRARHSPDARLQVTTCADRLDTTHSVDLVARRSDPLPTEPVKQSGRQIEPGVTAALVAAGVLILLVGFAALREQRRTWEASDWVRHTVQVLRQISVVQQLVTEAETGQRGFVLTGDRSYLEPYERASAKLPHALERLQRLTADNPSQQRRLEALAPIVAARCAASRSMSTASSIRPCGVLTSLIAMLSLAGRSVTATRWLLRQQSGPA